LTLIIGPIERALKLSTNPKVIEQLNFVDHNSKHLLSLVNQLMDFRKVETDNMPVNLAPGNFKTFIDDVLLPFRSLSQDNGIAINLYFHMQNHYIMFDKEAMVKILTNLIGNAVKFTPREGHIDVYVAAFHSPDKLYIAVQDSGSGIVENDIDKIFNRFYQSKTEGVQHNGSGTGIGLYLCKKLANLLGGDITACNNKTHGACFRMQIPLVGIQEQPAAPVSNYIGDVDDSDNDDDEPQDDTQQRMSVLVVEDNNEMRQYIRTVLCDTYTIYEAVDGNNALNVLRSNLIDLILSDLMMPGMNGMELAQQVRADSNISHIPIIILTAKTSRESMLESFRTGVDDYITKPFDETTLKAKILTLIENRRKFQQRFNADMDAHSLNIPEDSYDKKFIDKVLKIIKDNYKDSDFDVNELISQMGVSKTFMNKKMQALTQQSTGPFIRAYRLKVARDLIIKNRITHNMNISEIAYEVGFNDPKYFTRCFTKQYNATPSSMLEGEG
jgi:DNA-binding response OmpR family regulator